MPTDETVDLFGVRVARLGLPGVLDCVSDAIRSPRPVPFTLTYLNAHSCNLLFDDPTYRRALARIDLVYVDGNGPRLAAWLAGDWLPPRMTGADWIHDLGDLSRRRGYRLYFLGSPPGVADEAAARLGRAYPGLQVVGTRDGYLAPERESALLADIDRARPDILLLGMSSPLQEVWMTSVSPRLNVPVIWAAGGVLEYASGRLRRAPRWMRLIWLEWLGRWMLEPRRLTRRYLVGIPKFLWRAARHGLRRRTMPRRGG
jgi:N-acetylglucosaminyldiphosphoundecaprenol N-acetyl-beta-D-mannosaminyltransferase